MGNKNLLTNRSSAIGWGLLLIWWGLRLSVLSSLPEGSGLLGTSLILLGANAIRMYSGYPTYSDNTFLGLFSLLSGGILFTFAVLRLPYQPPIFETLIITFGLLLLGYAIFGSRKKTLSES